MDLHALTVQRDSEALRRDCFEGTAMLLACGIQPGPNCALFIQSHVKHHSELCWILTCIAKIGSLKRMTQYKDKSKSNKSDDLGLLA